MAKSNQNINHPQGVSVLFLTEMWERLSYYGMRAILILFLVQELKFDDTTAGSIYAFYTSFVYITPVLGGYITDRYLHPKFSIYLGAFLMLLGHLSLAIPGLPFLFSGLILLGLGNGFFKPTISTVFGRLYETKPGLRDSGFTLFYMGINLGGLIGPLVCGGLGESWNWHLGFASAAFGLGIGILVFWWGNRRLDPSVWERPNFGTKLLGRTVEENEQVSTAPTRRGRALLILLLSFTSILFWMAFEQMGSSMNLFALRHTQRDFFGWEIPASFFQSINPLFILLLGPFVSLFWSGLSRRQMDPNPVLKFVYALVLLGIGFLVMVFAARWVDQGHLVGMGFLVLAYFWNTISELFLSPVGLSFVSKTAPSDSVSFWMGVWFLSNAFGHYFAGMLTGMMGVFGSQASFFSFFVIVSWLGAFLLFLAYLWKKKEIQSILGSSSRF